MTPMSAPQGNETFAFVSVDCTAADNTLRLSLNYQLGDIGFSEQIQFPAAALPSGKRYTAFKQAIHLLHWVAGISYWKTVCPSAIRFDSKQPDCWQARFLYNLYRHGLAEFAFENKLDLQSRLKQFHSDQPMVSEVSSLGLRNAALVPMGGGKDSLVALEKVRRLSIPIAATAVRPAALIHDVVKQAGVQWLPVNRQIDPALLALNQQGAMNGHVPITAINMCVLIIAAILYDFNAIVFANEASADSPTRTNNQGEPVNHQYSKSTQFELQLQQWVSRYIATDLHCFSLLRPYTELRVCKEFAGLVDYHASFSSCNRQFHLAGATIDRRWCGECPKCLFVFLSLAPFLPKAELIEIFGRNLLNDGSLASAFGDLAGLGIKPFECVGTEEESRAALLVLSRSSEWRSCEVISQLAGPLRECPSEPLDQFLRLQAGIDTIPVQYQSLL